MIEGCGGGGGCLHGGGWFQKPYELLEDYVITNANLGKAESELDVHREALYVDEGNITIRKSTLLNPAEEVAIVFGETNEGVGNEDHLEVEESLISGRGRYEFGSGKNANAPLYPTEDMFKNNRFARCGRPNR